MQTVTTQIVSEDSRQLIEFLKKAFGAEELHVMPTSDGKVMHAGLRLGTSILFLTDANERFRPTNTNLYLYVDDVDKTYDRAVKAGAQPVAPVTNMFWGDRWGMVATPCGNVFQIATHVEDVSPEEMAQRATSAP